MQFHEIFNILIFETEINNSKQYYLIIVRHLQFDYTCSTRGNFVFSVLQDIVWCRFYAWYCIVLRHRGSSLLYSQSSLLYPQVEGQAVTEYHYFLIVLLFALSSRLTYICHKWTNMKKTFGCQNCILMLAWHKFIFNLFFVHN